MATKSELIEKAKSLGLEVSESMKIAELNALIANSEKNEEVKEEASTAKAGKRSAKSLREKEELVAKKAAKAEKVEAPKFTIKPTRTRLERQGKGIRTSAAKIDKGKLYDLKEAVKLAQETSHVKFDATVEMHLNLNVDPKHADQNIRDIVNLPAGTGKKIVVAVFTEDPKAATAAGADIAGAEDFLGQLDKGKMNFDILITTPMLMPKLSKYARVLGPRGLMPNPKSGTVTNDIAKAVKESKGGRVEYRVDSNGIVHAGLGKVSFKQEDLLSNISAFVSSIKANKPSSVKSNYLMAAYITTSMGPSIRVDVNSL
jgi:large subunit ribosomal protein L1